MNQTTLRLVPSLQFTPQISGRRRWYAVEDPQSGRFLKLGVAEYLIASGLQNGSTLARIVEVLDSNGFDNPRQRVAGTVSWLAKQGLLLAENKQLTSEITAEHKSPPAAAVQSKAAFDPFFIRLPLLSGAFVERIAKPFERLISWPGATAFIVLLIAAVSALLGSTSSFWLLSEKLFVEDGRLWWLVAWLVLKTVHELGHAVAAASTGSRIRSAGIHFIFLAPVPYVDVTDLWSITNRRQRILVSSAGMLAEMAVAAGAVIVAMSTSNLPLQYMCAALATLGTITTIAFNGNPLMKFDGYYILSDLLGRPNLWTEAQAAANGAIARVLNPFAVRAGALKSASGYDRRSARLSLTAFGLTTMFYRMLMLVTMAWWLLSVWSGIGALAIAWAVWGWFVRPYWLRRNAARAALAAGLPTPTSSSSGSSAARSAYAGLMAAALIIIGLLPSPRGVRAPGVVGFGRPTTVRSSAEGFLSAPVVRDRQRVQQGDLIARLDNPELVNELAEARLKHQTSLELSNALRARGELALLQAEQAKTESLAEHVQQLVSRIDQLQIRAPLSGMVLLSSGEQLPGRFLKAGQPLCMIVSPTELEVCASASQRDAAYFHRSLDSAVLVAAPGGPSCNGKLVSVDSRSSDECELQSLAAIYGGPLTVEFTTNAQGEKELKYPAPRFEVKIDLSASDNDAQWIPGQLVWIHLGHRPQRMWQWLSQAVLDSLEPHTVR